MFTEELEHVVQESHRIDMFVRYIELAYQVQIMWCVDRLHGRPKPHRALRIRFESQRREWAVCRANHLRYRMVSVFGLLMLGRRKLEVVTDIKQQEIQCIRYEPLIIHSHFISLCGTLASYSHRVISPDTVFVRNPSSDVPDQGSSYAFPNLPYDSVVHHR